MKKNAVIAFIAFGLFSCSVDKDELDIQDNNFLEKDAVIEIEGCETVTYSFGDAGQIEITNDEEKIYVSILALEDNTLMSTRLEIANDIADFPLVGKGNLPPGKMEHHKKFDAGVESYTFSFPVTEYGGRIVIASFSAFSGEDSGSYWAGEQEGNAGNWSYFEYALQECEDLCEGVDAGEKNSTSLTVSEAAAIGSWDLVRNLYLSLRSQGVPDDGSFDPSIWDIINAFNDAEDPVGEYTTTYTITEGECSDSVEFTLEIIPDEAE
ncbi:MAG: hypothetical protein R3353_00500 [Salegentibacter mishustinae]|nr:hypothetical protein [Salegentibacter mishustinae]